MAKMKIAMVCIWRWSRPRCVRPITALVPALMLLVAAWRLMCNTAIGVEFFPSVEPDYGLLYVHARGNLSLDEMDAAQRVSPSSACSAFRASSRFYDSSARRVAAMTSPKMSIGVINYEFIDWRSASPAHRHPGRSARGDGWYPWRRCRGPRPGRRPADRQGDPGAAVGNRSRRVERLRQDVAAAEDNVPGVIDLYDGLPPPGIDWALNVDRGKAAQYGVSAGGRRIGGAACHQRPEAVGIPAGGRR